MHGHHEPYRTLVVTQAPAALVTLDQAKAQCRVETTDDDDLLTGLVAAATGHLDAAGRGWLGAALMTQKWTLSLDRFPYAHHASGFSPRFAAGRQSIDVPFPPLITVESVKYYDTSGTQQTLASSAYQVSGIGDWKKARLAPAPSTSWPSTQADRFDAVTIGFTCGHATAGAVPVPIVQAILLLVSHLYENRDAVVVSSARSAIVELPIGVQALLAPLRIH